MKTLLLLLIFTTFSTLTQSSHHPIHLLRPKSGSHCDDIPGLSCLSWRLGVETHNIIEWKTVPKQCENYVGHYMLGQQYRDDFKAVVDEAFKYVRSVKLSGDGKEVWVFDVDETTLSNLPYYALHGFGTSPYNPKEFNKWVIKQKAPPLPDTLRLYNKLLSLNIKIVFLTGRSENQRNVTTTNLKNAGFHRWEKLILKGESHAGQTAVAYKSAERKMLEERLGYRIIGNMGDQWSDVLGSNGGNRTFKLPDPLYYIS